MKTKNLDEQRYIHILIIDWDNVAEALPEQRSEGRQAPSEEPNPQSV